MQVYPEPERSSATTSAPSTVDNAVEKSEAVPFVSQPSQLPPPPAYAPPVQQPPYNAYGFNPSFAPAPYGAPTGYGAPPTTYGYPVGSAAPPTQLQNYQNTQVNVMHATALQPVVAQPAPIVMSPPSYLGWSIFNLLCCFWPLGLAAIIYSMKVGSARSHTEAKSYSLAARNLNIAATTIAPILAIIVVGAAVGTTVSRSIAMSGNAYSYSRLVYYTSYAKESYLDYETLYYAYGGSYRYTITAYKTGTFSASRYTTAYSYYYG